MEHLQQIEDLTRRYANTRIGAAGLGIFMALYLGSPLHGLDRKLHL
jgi:hypothetical protein